MRSGGHDQTPRHAFALPDRHLRHVAMVRDRGCGHGHRPRARHQPRLAGAAVIGGADGPTAIFITGAANLLAPVLTPLWLAVPFILGCCAACVLLRWGQNGPRAKHTLALMLSAAALLCWLLLGILSLWQVSSAAGAAVLSWKTLLFQLFNLMLLPSFWKR